MLSFHSKLATDSPTFLTEEILCHSSFQNCGYRRLNKLWFGLRFTVDSGVESELWYAAKVAFRLNLTLNESLNMHSLQRIY